MWMKTMARTADLHSSVKLSLRAHLILHALPSFQQHNDEERVCFSIDMAYALFKLLESVAGHKSTKDIAKHVVFLDVLNQAACSNKAAGLIGRLAAEPTPGKRQKIAQRASQLKLERLSWHGLAPAKRRKRVETDRLPLVLR